MTSDQGTSAAAPLQDKNSFITPKNHGLNPNANEFHSKVPSPSSSTASQEPQWPPANGESSATAGPAEQTTTDTPEFAYMNGDVGSVDDTTTTTPTTTVLDDTPSMTDETAAAAADELMYDVGGVVSGGEGVALDAAAYATDATTVDDQQQEGGVVPTLGGVSDVSMVTPIIVQTVEAPPAPAAVLLSPTGMAPAPAAVIPAQQQLSPVSPVSEDQSSTATSQPPTVVGSSEEGSSPTTSNPGAPRDLRRLLRDQLEYYFSPENLASDSYLYSQMDADHFVAITTIANFNMVKRLTNDLGLIVDVLKESPVVQVDEAGEKVRPLHKRCIVILREVPQSTPVEIVKELFSGENCPRFISCEFAINNSWYITFDSDEDAQRAYRYLREERQTFLGKPIMARIKAKPLLRSTYVPKNGMKNHRFTAAATQFTPQAQPVQQQVTTSPQSAPAGVQFTSPPTSSYSPPVQQGLSYINSQPQQTYSAFFPSPGAAMVPAWPPNAQFFDPGMVFAVNGYQPQATFKHAPNRQFSLQSIRQQRNQGKPPVGRGHMGPMDRTVTDPPRAGMYERQHSAPPAPSGHRPSSNRSSDSYHSGRDAPPGGPPHRREPPSDRHSNWRDQSYGGSHYERGGHNHHMDGYGLPPRLEKEMNRRPPYRPRGGMRRGGRDDESGASKPSMRSSGHGSTNSSSGGASPRPTPPPPPRFELEPTNFPPLPGSNSNNSSGEVFENKMSDVVRGTAKPSTREARPLSDHSPVKDTPSVSNGNTSKHSPKKAEKTITPDKSAPANASPAASTPSATGDGVTSSPGDGGDGAVTTVKTSKKGNAKSSTLPSSSSSSSSSSSGAGSKASSTSGGGGGGGSAASTAAAVVSASVKTTLSSSSTSSTSSTALSVNTSSSGAASASNGAQSSSSTSSNAKNAKSQPAKEEKSNLSNHVTSPAIPAKISYAQMVARTQGNGSDSDSGPLSPAGDDDSSKEEANELSNGNRPKGVWETKEDRPREQRQHGRRHKENRRQNRSPTK